MALVFIDGFNSGDVSLWDYVSISGVNVPMSVYGMQATYSLYIKNTGMIFKNLEDSSEYTVGFYYKVDSASANMILGFYNEGTLLGELQLNTSSKRLEVYRGTTLLATGITTIGTSAVHIQVRYVPHVTNGYFQVKVNNVVDINFSGQTVETSAQINRIVIGSESATVAAYFSNIVIDNSGFPGMLLVGLFGLDGNGYLNEWVATSGQNYQCVDDVPANDADYVYTDSTGASDFYTGTAQHYDNIRAVKAVQVQARCRKIGEPDVSQIKLGVRISSTNYFGDAQDVGVSPKSYAGIWSQNPNTSSDWQKTELTALQVGIQSAGT